MKTTVPLLLTVLLTASLAGQVASAQVPLELAELERLAEESFAEDDLKTAVALYRQLAGRLPPGPERTRIKMTTAYLQHLAGRDADALVTVREALVEDPGYGFQPELYNDAFREIFYDGQKRAAEARSRQAEREVAEGTARLRQRDYGAAQRHFETALTYRGDHPGALYNLGLAHLHQQREEQAEARFQKLLALGDGVGIELRTLALTNLGYLYERRRQFPEARSFLEQAVEIDPSNARAWSILGAARRQLGDRSAAAEAFRRAYELSPEDPQAMGHLALAYIDARSYRKAVTLLEQATAADPDNANPWLHLGLARAGAGDAGGAVAAFETAIRLDPADAGGRASNAATQLARLHYDAGDYAKSLERADQALGWKAGSVEARIYQGLAREALGDLSGARASLEEARRLDPTRAETYNNLGSVYYQLGLFDEAEEALERALAIRGDFPGARANLAAVREARSRPRAAPAAAPGDRRAAPAPAPRLGVRFADIDYAALGLKGAMVEMVEAGSPAARAGLRKNDLILKVDGRDVANADELKRYVASRPPGSTVTLSLLRANVPQRVDVRLD